VTRNQRKPFSGMPDFFFQDLASTGGVSPLSEGDEGALNNFEAKDV